MIKGTTASQFDDTHRIAENNLKDTPWSWNQYWHIIKTLEDHELKQIKSRDEYTLFKEILIPDFTEVNMFGKTKNSKNPVNTRASDSGVISPLCNAVMVNDTTPRVYNKPFLAPLDIQRSGSIAEVIPSFRVIQSEKMSLNIGFDTEFQDFKNGSSMSRRVLSLQMSIAIGENLIRYFFLVDPRFQDVTAEGGMIPLKYCLADILDDLKKNYFHKFWTIVKKKDTFYDHFFMGWHSCVLIPILSLLLIRRQVPYRSMRSSGVI